MHHQQNEAKRRRQKKTKYRGLGKIIICSFLLIIAYFIWVQHSNKPKLSELKVALAGDFFPFAFAENDTLKGIEIELLSLLEKNLKVTVSITTYYFDNMLETFLHRDYDMALGGVTITDARSEIFDFSLPYYDATQTVLAMENNTIVVDSLSGIVGHRVGVLNGSSSLFVLENTLLRDRSLPVANLRRFNDLPSLFAALQNNDIALILLENTMAELACSERGFQIVYKYDFVEQYAFVLKKDSTLKTTINKALERVLSSDEWAKTLDPLRAQ